MGEPKTALVLSAGGMFGAYQVGAFQAIRECVDIDLVVGASVGALNGLPISAGCTPEHLVNLWRNPAAGEALRLFPNAGWRNGWFDPAPLRARAQQIHAEYTPRIPFGVVVVELPRLHTRLVQHPHILPEHLHATCSIPLFLPSVRIGDKRYLDGGLFEKLPLWAAIEMGATRIIAIDSLPNVGKWWLHLGIGVARLFKPVRRYPPDLELTLIAPSERLGDANDAVFWKRENIDRWIDLGRRDAIRTLSGQAISPARRSASAHAGVVE
jgi:NTE family protein